MVCMHKGMSGFSLHIYIILNVELPLQQEKKIISFSELKILLGKNTRPNGPKKKIDW